MNKTQLQKDNPMPWGKYKRFVEGIRYKDYRIKISPIAKYPGEVILQYRYEAWRPARAGESHVKMIYPIRVSSSRSKRPFTGFNSFDFRVQAYKKDFLAVLKKLDSSPH